jgi:hypothetical protein
MRPPPSLCLWSVPSAASQWSDLARRAPAPLSFSTARSAGSRLSPTHLLQTASASLVAARVLSLSSLSTHLTRLPSSALATPLQPVSPDKGSLIMLPNSSSATPSYRLRLRSGRALLWLTVTTRIDSPRISIMVPGGSKVLVKNQPCLIGKSISFDDVIVRFFRPTSP